MAVWINDFLIDAALSEVHRFPSEVTQFPTEEGSDLTDNIRPGPIEVQIEGVVSDTPIGVTAVVRQTQSAEAGDDVEVLPSEQALALLERIRDERKPVTIQTSLKVYERMAMEMLEVPRERTTGKALQFTASFRQITTATNERTVIRTATPAGRAKRKLGPKAATESAAPAAPHIAVFTWRNVPDGAGGIKAGPRPPFIKGSILGHDLVLRTIEANHYRADRPGYIIDGFVTGGEYFPYDVPFRVPSAGGALEPDPVERLFRERSDFTAEDALEQWRARFR